MNQLKTLPGDDIILGSIEYHLQAHSKKNNFIYIIAILLVAGSLSLLPFVFVDISISSPGTVHTIIEHQTLFAPTTGIVLFSRIRNNEKVYSGDTLLVFDKRVLLTRLDELHRLLEENYQAVKDLERLVRMCNDSLPDNSVILLSPSYAADYNSFLSHLRQYETSIQKVRADHGRNTFLYKQAIIPDAEYQHTSYELKNLLLRRGVYISEQLSHWQRDLTLRRAEVDRLNTDIDHVRQEIERHYLLAPLDGTIYMSNDILPGSMVFMHQRLAELSPAGCLVVHAAISPKEIGYIFKGQSAKIQVDAYNHHYWGLLQAEVLDISDDVVIDATSGIPYYRVTCQLLTDSLINRGGTVGHLRKGMTVNCRMMVTRKSIFHLMVMRIDQVLNPSANMQQPKN